MAKFKASTRRNALKSKMDGGGPSSEMYDGVDGAELPPRKGLGQSPPPEDGSDEQSPEVEAGLVKALSDAADGLESLAEKADPKEKAAILKIADQLRTVCSDEDNETPSPDEITKDSTPEKPDIGPGPVGTVY
jgi:hypothetical protein